MCQRLMFLVRWITRRKLNLNWKWVFFIGFQFSKRKLNALQDVVLLKRLNFFLYRNQFFIFIFLLSYIFVLLKILYNSIRKQKVEGKLTLKLHGFNNVIIIVFFLYIYNWFPLIHSLVFVSTCHCCHVDNYVWLAQPNNNSKNSNFSFNNGSNDLIGNQACVI